MRVLKGEKQTKIPCWNVYYVADIPTFLYDSVKKSDKWASAYHRNLKLLEVDKHTLDFMVDQCNKFNIPVTFVGEDLPLPVLKVFEDDPEYKYQEETAGVLATMPNALLQFGVGSGKTRITLLALEKRFKSDSNLRVLVVTGLAALQQNWVSDSDKFNICRGRFTVTGVGNSKESLKLIHNAGDGDILTANFDMLSTYELLTAFVDFNSDIVIFDEVHMITNMGNTRKSGAMRTEGLHELQGDHWSLSASPVKFTPFDWRSLLIWLRALSPDTTKSSFESYYGNFGFNYMGQRICESYKNLEKLLPVVNSVRLAFSGTKLPELTFVDVPVLDGDDKSPYNIKKYNNCINKNKISYVRDLGNPCVVACNITKPFSVWEEALGNFSVSIFDGTLNLAQRAEVLDRCINKEVDVLLLSISAGGVGLNLAEAFSDMVFIDCPNSLVDFWQGYGRIYRIGTKYPVRVHKVYCKGTSEEERWKQIYVDFKALKIFYEF